MALSFANAGTYGALNGYWGQSPGASLREFCDSGVQYASVGFVNRSPENDPTGSEYPSINFSSFCESEAYPAKDGKPTGLLRNCASLKTDIPYCQSKGVKIILSIGGDYNPPNNDYKVTTEKNGDYFAEFLYGAFGPYKESWKGPRPFDPSSSEHVAVDGFDFDIEGKFDNKPYIAMVDKFRALDKSLVITAAPQCPTNPAYFYLKELIQKASFDALFIQFYNNPSCDYTPNNDNWPDKFNLDDWADIVSKSDKSKSAKLFVGLPGSVKATYAPSEKASGYIRPEKVKELVCKYKDSNSFGGISLWDLNRAAENIIGGKSYLQHVQDALKYGCNPVPTTTSSIETSTSSTKTSTGSAVPTTFSVPANRTTSTSGGVTGSVPIVTASIVSSTSKWSNSTITSGASVPMTTSTVYTTSVHTITKCPPYVTDCPMGKVTTVVIPWYTTVCPVKETKTENGKIPQATPSGPGGVTGPQKTGPQKTGPQKTGPQKTGPQKTGPQKTGPQNTGPQNTGPQNTGPQNTAPQSATATGATATVHTIVTVPGGRHTLETFTKPVAATPKPGCSGPGCPGVAIPTGSWASTPVGPSAAPTKPVVAGASTLAIGLTGLIAMVAVQVFAL